jgi:hypothetical protein
MIFRATKTTDIAAIQIVRFKVKTPILADPA